MERVKGRVPGWLAACVAAALAAAFIEAQGGAPQAPLQFVSRETRVSVPTTFSGTDELIALDDVAMLFKVSVREDALTGGVAVSYGERSVVMSPGQAMASVNGRVVTLPSPVVRNGGRWLVPVEFLPRALAAIYDRRIDLRRASRLLVVGDLRVARVTARVESAGPSGTRAIVDVVPAVPVTATNEAGQVLLRVEADLLDPALPAAGSGLVPQIRAGERTITVALAQGAGAARATTATLPDRTRVVVEVPAAAAAAAATEAAAPPPRPAPAPPPPPGTATPRSADAGVRTVAIDAGHGGDDVGVRAADGLEEKHLVLDVARRLRALLEARMGLRVIMTRDEDRPLGPDERAAAANAGHADLFLSLHANAAFSPAAGGAEVLAQQLDAEGEAERGTRAITSLPTIGGGTRTIGLVRWDLAQAHHVADAWALATIVESELRQQVTMSPRPLRRTHLRVLSGAAMPAVHVEIAYLTNPDQATEAATDEFKNRVAQALASSVARWGARSEAAVP